MDRPIARRDFLNGVAIGITGAAAALSSAAPLAAQSSPEDAANYPPLRTGLRGDYPSSVSELDRIRKGEFSRFPVEDSDIREEYDLVIVGGGISGLSAAHFIAARWDRRAHSDPGQSRRFRRPRQAQRIPLPGTDLHRLRRHAWESRRRIPTATRAKALVKELGIEVERNAEFLNHELEQKYDLRAGTFFDKEHFGEDRLVRGNPRLPEFLRQSAAVRRRPQRSDPAARQESRLHGRHERRRETRQAGEDELSGLSC